MRLVHIDEIPEVKTEEDDTQRVSIREKRVCALPTEDFGRCEWTRAGMDLFGCEGRLGFRSRGSWDLEGGR